MNSKNLQKLSRAAAAALMIFVTGAYATAAEDAQVLMNQGNFAEALKRLDQHLAKNPQDAEARFTRGLALVRLNRSDEAVRVFSDLTRDYPQLPEPYNNLAVLYAQAGDYEKARDALEAALATHPSYATAHENLGDIYAALAGAAYNRALMLDQSNQMVRNKLNLVGQLDRTPAGQPATLAAAAPPAQPLIAAKPAAPLAPEFAPAAASTSSDAVQNAIFAWTNAWSAQDVTAYFNSYAEDFTPEAGVPRLAWEEQRRTRITKPKRIKVSAENAQVRHLSADQVSVSFVQMFESDSYSDQVNKVLELKRAGATWKITREYTR